MMSELTGWFFPSVDVLVDWILGSLVGFASRWLLEWRVGWPALAVSHSSVTEGEGGRSGWGM